MNNKPLLVLLEHFALAASVSIVSTIATLLTADLLSLGGNPIFVLLNRPSICMTRLDIGVMALLQSFGKNGTRPLVVVPLMAVTAPHVLSLVLL
jgi:hypothetical protein|tara:strand:- start:239 stop:520 length:282 start_codon:yes stop_codon:yes gene_type:complete